MELLDRFSEDVQELILRLRNKLLKALPHAHEIVLDAGYTVSIHYGPDDKPRNAVIYLAGYSKHVNVGFFDGTELDDPMRVLDGVGARMRHAKFQTLDQVQEGSWLGSYVEAAVEHAGLSVNMGDGKTTVRTRSRDGRRRVT
jgi:hypothetical protein